MNDNTQNSDADFDALPSASTQRAQPAAAEKVCGHKLLGVSVSSSNKRIVVQAGDVDPETVTIGSYAVIQGSQGDYLCMVTDVQSESDRARVRRGPYPDAKIASLRRAGAVWSDFHFAAHLFRPTGEQNWLPVRTVPVYLRDARTATQDEISGVFGDPNQPGRFHIGAPLDMLDMQVGLDMRRLAQRSVGLFGQSGTGKSYLGRMLLAGMIKNRVAAALIFDMHNEYGWQGGSEDNHKVKGLKQLFPTQVNIFTLDDESSRRRQSNPDMTVLIGMDQIEPEDIEVLQGVLDISESGIGAVYEMARRLGAGWLSKFLDDKFIDGYGDEKAALSGKSGMGAFADAMGQPTNVMAALRRKLLVFHRTVWCWSLVATATAWTPICSWRTTSPAASTTATKRRRSGPLATPPPSLPR